MIARQENKASSQPGPEGSDESQLIAAVQGALAELRRDAESLRDAAIALPVRARRVAGLKILRKKAQARRLFMLAGAGVFAAVVALFVACACVAMVLFGAASALSSLLDVPFWAGAGFTGLLLIGTAAVVGMILWKRYAASCRAAAMAAAATTTETGAARDPTVGDVPRTPSPHAPV